MGYCHDHVFLRAHDPFLREYAERLQAEAASLNEYDIEIDGSEADMSAFLNEVMAAR